MAIGDIDPTQPWSDAHGYLPRLDNARGMARDFYKSGYNFGLEAAAHRLETANDETSRMCIIAAIRAMKQE